MLMNNDRLTPQEIALASWRCEVNGGVRNSVSLFHKLR